MFLSGCASPGPLCTGGYANDSILIRYKLCHLHLRVILLPETLCPRTIALDSYRACYVQTGQFARAYQQGLEG